MSQCSEGFSVSSVDGQSITVEQTFEVFYRFAGRTNACRLHGLLSCAFGSSIYKTFRRHGLHLLAGLIQPGGVDAVEGAVRRGRTHAVCVAAQGWGEHGFAVPRVRDLPGYRI